MFRSEARVSRRRMLGSVAGAAGCLSSPLIATSISEAGVEPPVMGSQRLSVDQLRKWESLGYGMFIHFGVSTFLGEELPEGNAPTATYNPDRLNVAQWVSVARDAGMKYAILTTKHVAGHCLWPSRHSYYTVANSGNPTDVVEEFCKACESRGVLAGLYYCSWDNHHRLGSRTPSEGVLQTGATPFQELQNHAAEMPAFTTSAYQNFQTAQITELLTQYGPIAETWIDIPGILGRGYRTFLYHHVASLQPQTIIMMNSGISDGTQYDVDYSWPSDLIALERNVPPHTGHQRWREIEGRKYYMPGEVCDSISKNWFWVADEQLRSDKALLKQHLTCRSTGVNYLLNVPPDRHGLIPNESIAALTRLRKNMRF